MKYDELVGDVIVLKNMLLKSDHFIISFTIQRVNSSAHHPHPLQSLLDYSNTDIIGMRDFLLEYDFNVCYASFDAGTIWSSLKIASTKQ